MYTLWAPALTGDATHFGPAAAGSASWSGTRTWSGGPYTVTGCAWDGSPWAGRPAGWGNGSGAGGCGGYGPWGQWGNAWSWTTRTLASATGTVTAAGGAIAVITAPATVAVAVSGDVSSTTTLGTFGAAVVSPADGNEAASLREDMAVKVVGAVLGAVGLVVAML